MATPAYQGPGQPAPDTGVGWLGRLGSILGSGTTPTYLGDGQPSSSVGGGRVTPAYMPAANAPQNQDECALAQSCPIDPAALASGHIAIVIPRNAVCEREEPVATD
jgi:hypothetical protein